MLRQCSDNAPTIPDAPQAEEAPAPEEERPKTRGRPRGSKDGKPRIRRVPVAKLSLTGGYGTTVEGTSPSDCWYNLGEHLTLKEVDFQVRDYRGAIVPLLAPISFQLIFEC